MRGLLFASGLVVRKRANGGLTRVHDLEGHQPLIVLIRALCSDYRSSVPGDAKKQARHRVGPRSRAPGLRPFLALPGYDEEGSKGRQPQLLLNPAQYLRWLEDHHGSAPGSPEGTAKDAGGRSLNVSVVGVPNAGKSSLVNRLVGRNVCPHSQKVHTTRRNALGILTSGDAQVVFTDTPGLISEAVRDKFGLEDSLLHGPFQACGGSTASSGAEAHDLKPDGEQGGPDLVVVVQDVSNRFVRESLDKQVLKLLCLNPAVPSVLVLNKMDTIPKSRRVYDLIRKLTCDQLCRVRPSTRIVKGPQPAISVDRYFANRRKAAEAQDLGSARSAEDAKYSVRSYDDLLALLTKRSEISGRRLLSDSEIKDLTSRLVGWPGFSQVFTVSALHGDGVEDLRDFLLRSAKPSLARDDGHNGWAFPAGACTDRDPQLLVVDVLKSKFLDVLAHDVPYKIVPVIQTWSIDPKSHILKLLISVDSDSPRTTHLLLYHRAANLSKVAKLAERDLQNLFGCEVFVTITVNVVHPPRKVSRSRQKNASGELTLNFV